jgi:hypothetical protein
MPRLSLWKTNKSDDYRFFDRTISEMFTVGATDLYIHKYLGANNPQNTVDATLPHYDAIDPTKIQDLLFLENRDRKYDPNIYRLRGHYNVQNLDFDLSQFGLFLTNDIIFITVHYNDMIDVIGRKLMVGDVFELPHLTDYHPLNETIPIGLRRYYQITDANYASEGFSQTWYPHLWRVKCEPLVDSQEFANILREPINTDNYMGEWDPLKTYEPGYTVLYGDKIYTPKQPVPAGTLPTDPAFWEVSTEKSLQDIIGRYNKNLEINQAVIDEAERLVPKLGYDRKQLYIVPTYNNGEPAPPVNVIVDNGTPIWPTGTVSMVNSTSFRSSSPVLRISPAQQELFNTVSSKHSVKLEKFQQTILQMGETLPQRTDTGSGRVSGDPVITLRTLASTTPSVIEGPYGTADNTYATADQYLRFTITAYSTAPQVSVIRLVEIPSDLSVGLLISARVISENGIEQDVFPPNTRITTINRATQTITITNPTQTSIPAGLAITVNPDFTGTEPYGPPTMDYRADCDPRFQFIRRWSPRSFGYLAGYNAGEAAAPNGEPLRAGIAFPANPTLGDYFLRLDYLPQKLFRFDGIRWVEISQNVRTGGYMTDQDESQLSTFINNDTQTMTSTGETIPSRQSLSEALRIQPD